MGFSYVDEEMQNKNGTELFRKSQIVCAQEYIKRDVTTMRRSSHVASMSTGPSPEYGTKIFTGDVATKVGCRAAGVDTRAAPFRSSSCVPLLLRYICPPMGRPACVRWSNAEYFVVLIEQFLSKYGESAALLKDPSWTKDPQKADKGKSRLNVLVCGPPLTVGRATCYPCSPCSLSLDAMSP
jgi:hypothetical protein